MNQLSLMGLLLPLFLCVSAFGVGPGEMPKDPFNVTWYGRCGEDDIRAGRDTMEEIQKLVREANERAAKLAQEAAELSCKEGADVLARRGAIRLAAEANEKVCHEAVEAATESLWKRLGRRCGFYAIGGMCAHAVVAEAAIECIANPSVAHGAEWPPRGSCEDLQDRLKYIVKAEFELRDKVSAATKEKELALMTIGRLKALPSLTLLQETELKSAELTLEIAERRLAELLEEVRAMEGDSEKESIIEQLRHCTGGLYPQPTPMPMTPIPAGTPSPSPTPTMAVGPRSTPTPTMTVVPQTAPPSAPPIAPMALPGRRP